MSRAEKFIEENTRNCSQLHYNSACTLRHCITPDQARKAVEIAREETIKEACEYIKSHRENVKTEDNGIVGWIGDDFIEDLKKYMKGEQQ